MENRISALCSEWSLYLESATEQMQADIRDIIANRLIQYEQGKSWADIAAMFFEYEYEYMDIVFYAFDKQEKVITKVIALPTKRSGNIIPDSKWNAFLPEAIWHKEQGLDEHYDKYNREKTSIFKEWFLTCWKTVAKGIGNIPDAYFSIHDTFFRTDLKTGERVNNKQISARLAEWNL